MKTKYKYIFFRKSVISDISASKQIWTCHANKSGVTLGAISWYPSWKQYCVQFNDVAICSTGCLTDIADFLEQLNASEKNNIKATNARDSWYDKAKEVNVFMTK